LLECHTCDQQHFAISEVAADWHEPVIMLRIKQPGIARDNEQLNPQCSLQTQHCPSQLH